MRLTANFRSADSDLWTRAMCGTMTEVDQAELMKQQKMIGDMDARKTLFITSSKVPFRGSEYRNDDWL